MTLDQVLALDNRALNMAVGVRIGWKREGVNIWFRPDGFPFPLPDFSEDWWTVPMIQEWARSVDMKTRIRFHFSITKCVLCRLGRQVCLIAVDAIPIDYARAVCLTVEVAGA